MNFELVDREKKCFLYDEDHKVKNCNLLRKLRKLIKRSQKRIKTIKIKKDKHKVYNVEMFLMNSVSFIDVDSDNEKNIKKIFVLFKELINKIYKLN